MAPRVKSHVWLEAMEDQQDKADDGKIKAAPSYGLLMVGFLGVFERRVT
jgi:hypothetical protein